MELEKGRIAPYQLTVLIVSSMMATTIILYPGGRAENNVWLAVIAGLGEALFFTWILLSLSRNYPGKTLLEINDCVWGPYLGKIFSVLYILYFLHLAAMVLSDYAYFLGTLFPVTPFPVFVLTYIALLAFMIKAGLEVIGRVAIISFLIMSVTTFMLLVLNSNHINTANLLPFMQISVQDFLLAAHGIAVFPFGEILVFFMIVPFLNNNKKTKPAIIYGLLITASFLVVDRLLITLVLGNFTEVAIYKGYEMVRLIDIGSIITRVEVLGASNGMILAVIKAGIFYYAAVLGLAQICKLRSYTPLILPVGVLIFVLSVLQFNSSVELFLFNSNTYPYYAFFFQAVLPLLTLLSMKLKKIRSSNQLTPGLPGNNKN